MKKIVYTFSILCHSAAASACPVCTSPRALQVRSYLFGPELAINLFSLLLPFLIFAAITVCVYHFDFTFNKKRI